MKKSGGTSIVILSLLIVILLSGVAISIYLYSKEAQIRKETEIALVATKDRNVKIEAALNDAQQQIDVLKGKNKDADDKINSLLEELDMEKALREQVKEENKKFKDALEAEAKGKIELRQKMTAELDAAQAKIVEAQNKVMSSEEKATSLQQKVAELQQKNDEIVKQLKEMEEGQLIRRSDALPVPVSAPVAAPVVQDKVNLDRIVITPASAKEGKVLNVDTETEFLIFDIGTKSGVKQGDMMSVYRGKTYLGDVKVSRAQEEMSAADFIPPFSSRKVRKNDQVVPKR
ncbi:MAG: hypothetical protein HQL21_01610 [Candidatus Omnitrophica bacterium]|nr:hypothetical protein [Candidatus Omnitrophota bacterium]